MQHPRPESMPRVHRQVLLPQNVKPLPHDVGGKLSDLHVEALAMVVGAQFLGPADPSNPAYVWALERAITCTKSARAGWLAVRTEALPAGDVEGAGKAAVALAGFYLELDRLGEAMSWLACARKELGPAYENMVVQNLECVLAHVEQEYEATLQRDVFAAWTLRAREPAPAM
jgi:hypothetical protein